MLHCSQSLFVCRVSFQGHASRCSWAFTTYRWLKKMYMKVWAKLYDLCTYRICEQYKPRWACTFAQFLTAFAASNWKKKKRCSWRFRPNYVLSKAAVQLLLIHSLMFLLLDCGGSVFGPCLVMHYLPLLGVLYSCAIILTRKRERESLTLIVFLLLMFCDCSSRCRGLVWSV